MSSKAEQFEARKLEIQKSIKTYCVEVMEALLSGEVDEIRIPFSNMDDMSKLFDILDLDHEFNELDPNGCDQDWSFSFEHKGDSYSAWGGLIGGHIIIDKED